MTLGLFLLFLFFGLFSIYIGLLLGKNYFLLQGLTEGVNKFSTIYLKIMKDRFGYGEDDTIRILIETAKELNEK